MKKYGEYVFGFLFLGTFAAFIWYTAIHTVNQNIQIGVIASYCIVWCVYIYYKKKQNLKNNIVVPSNAIQEIMDMHKMNLLDLSHQSGIDYPTLLEVMEVKRPIDETIAQGLETALEVPVNFWLMLEKDYQIRLQVQKNRK